MRKKFILCVILLSLVSLTACENSTAKQALEQAKFAMADGDYTKAQNMYQLALDEGSKDETIADSIEVLSAYRVASEAFYNNNLSEARTALESITVDYQKLPIKDDLEKLKKSIEERDTEIETNSALIQELQTLFDKKCYQDVVDKATQMLTWNLTDEQKSVANSLLEQSNAKIKEINDKKVPKMILKYVVNQSDMEMQGKFYQNGNGKLVFGSGEPFEDMGIRDFYPDVKFVTYTVPMSRVRFQVLNPSTTALTNPMIQLEFHDVYLIPKDYDNRNELTFSNFVNGVGVYTNVTWEANSKTIQPNTTQEFTLDMSECAILLSGANVKITISADNFPAQTFTIPVSCE